MHEQKSILISSCGDGCPRVNLTEFFIAASSLVASSEVNRCEVTRTDETPRREAFTSFHLSVENAPDFSLECHLAVGEQREPSARPSGRRTFDSGLAGPDEAEEGGRNYRDTRPRIEFDGGREVKED